MKIVCRISILLSCLATALLFDLVSLSPVSDANAYYYARRRAARRTAIAMSTTAPGGTVTATTGQSGTTTAQQADAEDAAAVAAHQDSASASSTSKKTSGALPIGSIVTTLPAGCKQVVVKDVAYQYDGVNYYRAAFQGEQLVYVTSKP